MFKELENDIEGFQRPEHGDLTGWARQGVLLLNACLTVRKASANSHKDKVGNDKKKPCILTMHLTFPGLGADHGCSHQVHQ